MLQTIKNLLGIGSKADYRDLVKQGALILDVRTKNEFSEGHIPGAVNIPIEQLEKNLAKLKDKKTPIICCCASGMRSGMAKTMLKSKGYETVYNGGSWKTLKKSLS